MARLRDAKGRFVGADRILTRAELDLQRKYTQDQPRDAHGRFGSGGTGEAYTPPALRSDAETVRVEANHEKPNPALSKAERQLQDTLGKDAYVDLGGMKVQYAQEIADRVSYFAGQYPRAAEKLTSVSTYVMDDNTIARTMPVGSTFADERGIVFNSDYYGTHSSRDFAAISRDLAEQGFHPVGTTAATVDHELAHVLSSVAGTNYFNIPLNEARAISRYAASDPGEAFAEAFANQQAGGTNPPAVANLLREAEQNVKVVSLDVTCRGYVPEWIVAKIRNGDYDVQTKYAEGQPRDDHGRFSTTGGDFGPEVNVGRTLIFGRELTSGYHYFGNQPHPPSDTHPRSLHDVAASALKGGFTYQPFDKETPTQGFAVGAYPNRAEVFDLSNPPAPDDAAGQAAQLATVEHDLQHFVNQNEDILLPEPRTYYGGYVGPHPDDLAAGIKPENARSALMLDVSIVTDTQAEAERIAKAENQQSIFDLADAKVVETGGTGAAKLDFAHDSQTRSAARQEDGQGVGEVGSAGTLEADLRDAARPPADPGTRSRGSTDQGRTGLGYLKVLFGREDVALTDTELAAWYQLKYSADQERDEHGRFGSGSGSSARDFSSQDGREAIGRQIDQQLKQAFPNAKIRSAEEVIRNSYGSTSSDPKMANVEQVTRELSGMSKGLTDAAKDYPNIAANVGTISFAPSGLWAGSTDRYAEAEGQKGMGGKFKLDLNPYGDTSAAGTTVAGSYDTERYGEGVATHEFGHMVHMAAAINVQADEHLPNAEVPIRYASTISQYAATNSREGFAEAFTADRLHLLSTNDPSATGAYQQVVMKDLHAAEVRAKQTTSEQFAASRLGFDQIKADLQDTAIHDPHFGPGSVVYAYAVRSEVKEHNQMVLLARARMEADDILTSFKYSEDQPRDSHGRFGSDGGGVSTDYNNPVLTATSMPGASYTQTEVTKALLYTGLPDPGHPYINASGNPSNQDQAGAAKAEVAEHLSEHMTSSTEDLIKSGSFDPNMVESAAQHWADDAWKGANNPEQVWRGITDLGGKTTWVMTNEDRGAVDAQRSEHGLTPLAWAHGGDPELLSALREQSVSNLVSNWAGTANDFDPRSLAMQESAIKEFGLTDVKGWDWAERGGGNTDAIQSDLRNNGPVFQDFLRTQYNDTQTQLADAGIHELTLYRGLQNVAMDDPLAGPATYEPGSGVAEHKVDMTGNLRPISSWSSDSSIARDFSGEAVTYAPTGPGMPATVSGATAQSTMLAASIPAERILSYPRTGMGALSEAEFTVLAGPGPGLATNTSAEAIAQMGPNA